MFTIWVILIVSAVISTALYFVFKPSKYSSNKHESLIQEDSETLMEKFKRKCTLHGFFATISLISWTSFIVLFFIDQMF